MGIALFVGVLFFLIGIGIIIASVFYFFKRRNQIANSLSAEGSVTTFAKGMGRSGYLHYPVVEFKIPSGQTITFQSSVGSRRAGYAIGQQVKVLYVTGNPQEAEIDSPTSLWFVTGCMFVMGLGFTMCGLFQSVVMTLVMMNQP